MKLLKQDLKYVQVRNDIGEQSWHVFDQDMIDAVNAALVINRPLLIWGEPGIGKSQLARAVAKELKRVFVHFVSDARTESRDLLYHFDAVARLAEAQLRSHQGENGQQEKREEKQTARPAGGHCLADRMAMENFIVPGCLWWALNWESAKEQAARSGHEEPVQMEKKCRPENGVVLLIDEIDKADTDVPNGLLEALGSSRFHPHGLDQPVECQKDPRPLVMITTNEERTLPDAFLRRCLSLHLGFPDGDESRKAFLVERGVKNHESLARKVVEEAAEFLLEDRRAAKEANRYPLPGQAEFFDLLRGVQRLSREQGRDPMDYIRKLRKFTYQKHPDFHRKPGQG